MRKALYMATVVATRFEPLIRDFYQRLLSKGKPYKVAVTACMRKLLTVLKPVCVITLPGTVSPKTVSKRLDLSFGIFARRGEKYSCYACYPTLQANNAALIAPG